MTIGGVSFRLESAFSLKIQGKITPFLTFGSSPADVVIRLCTGFPREHIPKTPKTGEDLLLEYYRSADGIMCLAKGSLKGPLAVTYSDPAYTCLTCYLNSELLESLAWIETVLRVLPMRSILQHHGVLFFHASQIVYREKGILFTAPSGTGKTTQAKLWRDTRGAEMICNDRTLIHSGKTYGYPVDGSEPICSGEENSLGAVVLLAQGTENQLRYISPAATIARLMSQLVIDTWDNDSHVLALGQLISLTEKYPVYHLSCTPDEKAVICLEKKLKEDGVIS